MWWKSMLGFSMCPSETETTVTGRSSLAVQSVCVYMRETDRQDSCHHIREGERFGEVHDQFQSRSFTQRSRLPWWGQLAALRAPFLLVSFSLRMSFRSFQLSSVVPFHTSFFSVSAHFLCGLCPTLSLSLSHQLSLSHIIVPPASLTHIQLSHLLLSHSRFLFRFLSPSFCKLLTHFLFYIKGTY